MNCKGMWWARGRWWQTAWQSIEPRQSLILRVTLLLVRTKCSWTHLQIRHKPQKAHSACDATLPPTKSTSLNSRGHRIRHSYSLSQDVRYRNSQSHNTHIPYTPSSFTGTGLCHFACQLSSQLHHVSRIGGKVKEDRRIGGEKEVSPSHQFGSEIWLRVAL